MESDLVKRLRKLYEQGYPPVSALEEAADRIEALEAALRWYGDKAAGCRKITREGEEARHALDCDGGKLAREVLGSRAALKQD